MANLQIVHLQKLEPGSCSGRMMRVIVQSAVPISCQSSLPHITDSCLLVVGDMDDGGRNQLMQFSDG